MSKLLPPHKSKWREGNHQIGLFIRTDSGREVEIVWDDANKIATAAAFELLHILSTGERPEMTGKPMTQARAMRTTATPAADHLKRKGKLRVSPRGVARDKKKAAKR